MSLQSPCSRPVTQGCGMLVGHAAPISKIRAITPDHLDGPAHPTAVALELATESSVPGYPHKHFFDAAGKMRRAGPDADLLNDFGQKVAVARLVLLGADHLHTGFRLRNTETGWIDTVDVKVIG